GAAVVLHWRVPPAPTAALADLGGTSPTGHGGRLDRVHPVGRHAVRRPPFAAAGGAPVDPGGGHAPDAVGVRRRCPRSPDHPAVLLAALPGAAARHDRPALPRAPPGPPDRAHPPARLAQPARLWLAWPGPAWAWLAWPGPESRGGHLTGAVLCHLRGAHHAGYVRPDRTDLEHRPVPARGDHVGSGARLVHGVPRRRAAGHARLGGHDRGTSADPGGAGARAHRARSFLHAARGLSASRKLADRRPWSAPAARPPA